MQQVKYFFDNIPLNAYCLAHGLNPNSVRTRVWKKRNNPKYAHLTDQEIVNLVIKTCNTGTIYMVGDISLRKYCQEHDINFQTIISRINKLKAKKPNLTNDELVKQSLDCFENHNFTLYVDNIPLKDYCALHPDLKYNTIRGHILNIRNQDPNKSVTEIVHEYEKKEHFGIYRYYYCGIPLKEYCDKKNISYRAIIARINRYTKKHPITSDDELVNIIMDEYSPFIPKYQYNGTTLRDYCINHDISYYSVVSFVKRALEKDSTLNIDTLIDTAIKTIKKQGIIYYYDGIPLRDYCRINHLNASSIRSSIIKKKATSSLPLQEIVNKCVEAWHEAYIKYYYDDEPLFTYCKKNNINYNTIISRYLDLNITETDEERKITLKSIVDEVRRFPKTRIKYYFQEQSLRQYCLKSNYSYSAIHRRIKKYQREFEYTLKSEVVEEAVITYEAKNILKTNYDLFNYLSSLDDISKNLDIITSTLNIDIESLNDMIEMGFDSYQAILLIWFLSKTNPKSMTDDLLKQIYSSISIYQATNSLDIYSLYVLYKTCIIDTTESILLYFEPFLENIIIEYEPHYKKLSLEELNTLWLELNSYFLMLLDTIYLDDKQKFLKHIMYLLSEKIRIFYLETTFPPEAKTLKKEFT